MVRIEQFDGAALDFDGSNADTRSAMTESRLEAFASMAEELGDERYLNIDPAIHKQAHHHGSHPLEIFGWVMTQAGIIVDLVDSRATVQRAVDRRNEIYWQKAQAGFDALPEAIETIIKLHEYLDDKISIVTTAPLDEEVMPFLKRHGIVDLFDPDYLITKDAVSRLKPDPEAYSLAMGRMGVNPDRTLALEDAHAGIWSARRANILEVVALTTTHTAEELQAFPSDERPTLITPTHADFQRVFFNN